MSPASLRQHTTLATAATRRPSLSFTRLLLQPPLPSLFLPFLPYRCLLVAAAAASPTSLALSRAFLPLHLHHRRCPTSSLQLQPSPATIVAPLQSPPLLAASSLLSALTAATHRCLLPCRCCPHCRYRFQSRPCRCTSLLPLLELFAATAAPSPTNFLIYW
ncbi:hypothetical protein BHE74_00055916 [Ensete ventricosum]|nr:hypothetical protein BHE74_00055916 [Ensete ventricosum]